MKDWAWKMQFLLSDLSVKKCFCFGWFLGTKFLFSWSTGLHSLHWPSHLTSFAHDGWAVVFKHFFFAICVTPPLGIFGRWSNLTNFFSFNCNWLNHWMVVWEERSRADLSYCRGLMDASGLKTHTFWVGESMGTSFCEGKHVWMNFYVTVSTKLI